MRPSAAPRPVLRSSISRRFPAIALSSSSSSRSRDSYCRFKASSSPTARSTSSRKMAARFSISASTFRDASLCRRNRFRSSAFTSSRSFKYFSAVSDCLRSGSTCFESSCRISETRTRLSCSVWSFFSAAAFRFLNFVMPAASSKSSRRSSGLPDRIFSTWPWPMIEYPSCPMPVSIKSSLTSFRRQGLPFKRYSLSPERYSRLDTVTSS